MYVISSCIMPENDAINNEWANLIREAFHRSGLSRFELAKRSGVHYSAVHAFIGGTKDPTLWTTMRLCKALGLELRPARRKRRCVNG